MLQKCQEADFITSGKEKLPTERNQKSLRYKIIPTQFVIPIFRAFPITGTKSVGLTSLEGDFPVADAECDMQSQNPSGATGSSSSIHLSDKRKHLSQKRSFCTEQR